MIATRMPAQAQVLDDERVADEESRIERWIVSNLDDDGTGKDVGALSVANLSFLKKQPDVSSRMPARPEVAEPWTRFQVVKRREITVVKLRDASLVRENILLELDDELSVLLDAGVRRVVLDFGRVERLSSHLIITLAKAYRRCTSTAGGFLRICRLRPEVAEILAISGLVPDIENFPDEKSAVDAPWPGPSVIVPLPVSILSAFSSLQSLGAEGSRRPTFRTPARSGDRPTMPGLRLIVASGKATGRVIPITRPRITIGREACCDLRFNSPNVSRLHARIERRGEVVVLRDLGSTNGSDLNGVILRDQEATLAHDDLIEIGAIRFQVKLGGEEMVEDRIVSWLADECDGNEDVGDTMTIQADTVKQAGAKGTLLDLGLPEDKLKCELIEDVLILTPMGGHLDDEATVGLLRDTLMQIFERPLPSRLVINLGYVGHISSLAIGVLIAHQLRLQRSGGAMRFCLAQPLVLSYLTLIRLPMLVECYPSLDDAVLTTW